MLPPNIVSPESELPPNAFTPEFPAQSKRLAYLLQHSNLPDKYGWVSVDVLCKESGYKEHIIRTLVLFDDKGRFIFSDDQMKVRALYGHSIKIESDAVPMQPPAVLYQGTAVKSLASIFEEGIKPMSRAKVHLSPTYGMATSSEDAMACQKYSKSTVLQWQQMDMFSTKSPTMFGKQITYLQNI